MNEKTPESAASPTNKEDASGVTDKSSQVLAATIGGAVLGNLIAPGVGGFLLGGLLGAWVGESSAKGKNK